MKRLVFLFLFFTSFCHAQLASSGQITASGTTCATTNACISLPLYNSPTVSTTTASVVITGTFSGTIQFEASSDGVTFAAINGIPLGGGSAVTSTTSTGTWTFGVAALSVVRTRASAFASGSASIALQGAVGSGATSAAGVIALFTGCSGTQYLGADGACHASGGGGNVSTTSGAVFGAFLYDFSGSTMEIPEAAGFTTNVDSTIGLDTTGNCPHFWTNNADSFNVATTATSTTTTFGLFATAVPCIYTARAIAAGDIPSGTVTLDKVGGAAAAATITETATTRAITLAGIETNALTYPYVVTNANTTATSSGALVVATTGAGGTAQVPLAVVETVAGGDFVDFYSLATVAGTGAISGGSIKASVDSSGSFHVVAGQGLQGLTSTSGVVVQSGMDGSTVNSTLTVRGPDHTATAGTNESAGTLVLRGGNNNSTASNVNVLGGPASLMAGRLSNASPGALAHEGVLDIDFAYKGAGTIGTLGCPSATAETIVSCASVAANQTWIGIISSTIGGSQAVQTSGEVSATFDASITATPGDIVCTSTSVAGDVFDSVAVPCPNVQSYVGRVKYQVTAATTAAVVVMDHNPQVMGLQAKVAATAQTAAISTATLCTAAVCAGNPGHYRVDWEFTGGGTACSSVTAGSATFLLTWTDENAVTHSAVALQMMAQTGAATTAMGGTFPFQTVLANEGASGSFSFSTNGTIIQYATGYTACTTGTGTYSIRAEVARMQ